MNKRFERALKEEPHKVAIFGPPAEMVRERLKPKENVHALRHKIREELGIPLPRLELRRKIEGPLRYISACSVDGRLTVVAGRCYDRRCKEFQSE